MRAQEYNFKNNLLEGETIEFCTEEQDHILVWFRANYFYVQYNCKILKSSKQYKRIKDYLISVGAYTDLFQHYNEQPEELQAICDKWQEIDANASLNYTDLEQFLKEVQAIGYTFDYYLDAEPYNLRKIQ